MHAYAYVTRTRASRSTGRYRGRYQVIDIDTCWLEYSFYTRACGAGSYGATLKRSIATTQLVYRVLSSYAGTTGIQSPSTVAAVHCSAWEALSWKVHQGRAAGSAPAPVLLYSA